jgi:FkbM family methyltransferase
MSVLYRLENLCRGMRHSALLQKASPLWNALRPIYNAFLKRLGRRGLTRLMNGTDRLLLCPEYRGTGEVYEPEVWALVMSYAKPGVRAIDVGAHTGLYAVALGLRVGAAGKVLAAEPDPANLDVLRRHLEMNRVDGVVEVVPAGLAEAPGDARMETNCLLSRVSENGGVAIRLETLDRVAGEERWDLMLIDVEGHEEKVLRGGASLLANEARRPGVIVIEVHPYAWPELGMSSLSLLGVLRGHGYQVTTLDGREVTEITHYGHIVARQPGR